MMKKEAPSKLTVELLEQSLNPTIRTMFTSDEAGKEIDRFVAKHHLKLSTERTSRGPSGIVLTGALNELQEFIKTYLSEDGGRGVFNLEV